VLLFVGIKPVALTQQYFPALDSSGVPASPTFSPGVELHIAEPYIMP
jgi:hypothetical protein